MADMEWRRICCPIDFSEPARAGMRAAADLCRRLGGELVLLYTEAGPKVAEELPGAGTVEAKLRAWKEEAERLGASRTTLARAGGPPEVGILNYASEAGIDLIVMGTHGRVDREHMLTGSVAEGVVRSSACPVLTVRSSWKA